jgi:hypothetical protein
MIKCGDGCGLKYSLNVDARRRCAAKAACVCNSCSTFQAISLGLYQGCMEACNGDESKRPKSKEAYMKQFDPYDLFTRYGIIVEGFDPKKTIEYEKNTEAQKSTDAQQGTLTKIVTMGIIGLSGILLYFFFKK